MQNHTYVNLWWLFLWYHVSWLKRSLLCTLREIPSKLGNPRQWLDKAVSISRLWQQANISVYIFAASSTNGPINEMPVFDNRKALAWKWGRHNFEIKKNCRTLQVPASKLWRVLLSYSQTYGDLKLQPSSLQMNFNKGSFAFTTESQVGTLLALLTTVHKLSSLFQHMKHYHVDEFNYQTGFSVPTRRDSPQSLCWKPWVGFDSHETKKLLCWTLWEAEVIQILKQSSCVNCPFVLFQHLY